MQVLHTEGWKAINWKRVQRRVFRLQKRIYRASERGDWKQVRNLQRLMQRSWSARALAVRRVTQDNRGKRTAGVDGRKKLTPPQRLSLLRELGKGPWKADPVRRVFIPKVKGKERPLGIPTMRDRGLQALVKLGLEPEWEAKFEANSYGFRPGRSAHDAARAIFDSLKHKSKYVLDADITGCFDHIDHDYLLKKLRTIPVYERLIRGWLTAGVFHDGDLLPTLRGTPQGGVISPLLANIALDGLETEVRSRFDTDRKKAACIRFADDFVILHQDRETLEAIKKVVEEWLAQAGLTLSREKTRIAHTLHDLGSGAGFDFLGFNFRQYRVGRHRAGRNTHGKRLPFKTLITPSKQAQRRHVRQLKHILRTSHNLSAARVIGHLNSVIRGWCSYYRHVVSKHVFTRMEHLLSHQLRRWARRKHPRTRKKVLKARYWNGYTFQQGHSILLHHGRTSIVRHVKVQGRRSPFDGDWMYWSLRQRTVYGGGRGRVVKLHKRQGGRCKLCHHYFQSGDQMEVHHRDGHRRNNRLDNLWLLHGHCHDSIHGRSARDKGCQNEEPDASKEARPVLKWR